MRILIADDEPTILELFTISLSIKHEVTSAPDGETALMYYYQSVYGPVDSRNPYDLLILDQRLSKKTGVEVAKEILMMNPSQKIILITAYPIEDVDMQGLSLQILQKPVDPDELIKQAEAQLSTVMY